MSQSSRGHINPAAANQSPESYKGTHVTVVRDRTNHNAAVAAVDGNGHVLYLNDDYDHVHIDAAWPTDSGAIIDAVNAAMRGDVR